MVASGRKKVAKIDLLAEDKNKTSSRRNTRGSKALLDNARQNEMNTVSDKPTGSVRQRKAVRREGDRLVRTKGKKKEKTLSPAVVDVVFGRLQSSVADVEELRRKREQDTLKCGRRVKTVG